MAARIESRHNLFLPALVQHIVFHTAFQKDSLSLVMPLCHATTLQPYCLIISQSTLSLFELICTLAVWSQSDGLYLCTPGDALILTSGCVEKRGNWLVAKSGTIHISFCIKIVFEMLFVHGP